MDLKDAEVKKLVQRQVQLHTMVFQQKGIKIPLSSKGKSREVSELLKDLENIIRERTSMGQKKTEHSTDSPTVVFYF